MIQNLALKAQSEKYYKSIRYFSHLLKGDKRRDFITELSRHNIYLAAQCIMSAEKDEEFERILVRTAELYAKDFENAERSAKGFLALTEFESFKIISTLLRRIDKPDNTHFNVLSEILKDGNSEIFITFIRVLLEIDNIKLIIIAIRSFKSTLEITNENQNIIKSLIDFLKYHGEFLVLLNFLIKHDLFEELPRIINLKSKSELVRYFLRNYNISAFKIVYEIGKRHFTLTNLDIISLINFSLRLKNIHSLVFAIQVANSYNLKSIEVLDIRIDEILEQETPKSNKQIERLLDNELHKYVLGNKLLEGKLLKRFPNPDKALILLKHRNLTKRFRKTKYKIDDFELVNLEMIMKSQQTPQKIFDHYFYTKIQ